MIVITKKIGIEEVMIHVDNCEIHNSPKTMKRVEELHVTRLPIRYIFLTFYLSISDFWARARI